MKIAKCYLVLVLAFASASAAVDHSPGDRVTVGSDSTSGAPVREEPTSASYVRWPNGTVATVVEDAGRWVQIEANGIRRWVLEKYLATDAPVVGDGDESPTVGIGAWNLEYLHSTATRGFPELRGDRALPPRTDTDFALIAAAIRERLRTPVLMLSEINGVPGQARSRELDRLMGFLGPSWKYGLGSKGGLNGKQRVAIIYDEEAVEALTLMEIDIDREVVDKEDVFDRDPLVGHFRVRRSEGVTPAMDFVVVSLHLASGQENYKNHNRAMERLRAELRSHCSSVPALSREDDIILGGDINASRYDRSPENFWEDYDSEGYRFLTLAPEEGADYPPTRLKGYPLYPGSQIDYLFASAGLLRNLAVPVATVHHELVPNGDFLAYRRHYSDHFPVTVRLVVTDDDD